MVDNVEQTSAASSDISDSLREQILGKSYARRRPRFAKTIFTSTPTRTGPLQTSLFDAPYEVVPSKETSFEVATVYSKNNAEKLQKQNDNKEKVSGEKLKQNSNTAYKITNSQETVPNNKITDSTKVKNSRHSIGSQNNNTNLNLPLQMSQIVKKQFQSIETQTVTIQTVSAEIDARGDCNCKQCCCNPRDPPNCLFEVEPKKLVPISETTSNTTIFNGYSESSNNSLAARYKVPKHHRCSCQHNWSEYNASTVQISDSDEDSYNNDFLNLPYQNNEEYLTLLKELEKKLIARNRDRVRRTMVEFERLSRQNQSLKKPIFDYDADDTFMKKLNAKPKQPSVCCKCGRNKKVNSDIMQNEKKWDNIKFAPDVERPETKHCVGSSMRKSHWRLNPRTGEWVKTSCFEQTDFVRPTIPFCQEEIENDCGGNCFCRQKKIK